MSHFDNAIEIAQTNESGAARCILDDGVELLVSNRGDCFTVWNFRAGARRIERVVSAAWAYKFLNRAIGVRVVSFDW